MTGGSVVGGIEGADGAEYRIRRKMQTAMPTPRTRRTYDKGKDRSFRRPSPGMAPTILGLPDANERLPVS
jgi:hypothetical protein